MGTLRLGVLAPDGQIVWLDTLPGAKADFRPGYTDYRLNGSGWKISVRIAPTMEGHGLVCRVEFDQDIRLAWQYGGIWWVASEANANKVEVASNTARITEPNLPDGLVMAGWDEEGQGSVLTAPIAIQIRLPVPPGRGAGLGETVT